MPTSGGVTAPYIAASGPLVTASTTTTLAFPSLLSFGLLPAAVNMLVVIDNPTASAQTINAGSVAFTNSDTPDTATITYNLTSVSIAAGHSATFFVALSSGYLPTATLSVTFAANPTAATLNARLVMIPGGAGGGGGGSGVTSFNTRTGAVVLTTADVNAVAPTSLGAAVTGPVGSNFSLTASAPAAASTTTAGVSATLQASAAIAGTVTAGAAAGGDVDITAGAAARLTSGNANGGNVLVTPGSGIGTGSNGGFRVINANNSTQYLQVDVQNANPNLTAPAGALNLNSVLWVKTSLATVGNAMQFSWSSTTNNFDTADTGLQRAAANVVGVTAGASGKGWLQNSAGDAALASNFTNATAALASTNLSYPVLAGRSYKIQGLLIVSNSTAGEGAQFDFGGGGASATTFNVTSTVLSGGTVSAGTVIATSLTGVINYTSVTGTVYLLIQGYLKVNAGGTIIFRAAENTHSTGTLTLAIGSWLSFVDVQTL